MTPLPAAASTCDGWPVAAKFLLDHVPIGIVLVDATSTVHYVNRAARQVVECADGLAINHGKIAAAHPRQSRDLRQAITNDRVQQESDSCCLIALRRPSGKQPLCLMVCQLPQPWINEDGVAVDAIVFVSDPERDPVISRTALCSLFDLTHAEANLTAFLAQGHGLTQSAEKLSISLNTAKTHQRRIFAKLNVARQSQLVRVVLLSPAAELADGHGDIVTRHNFDSRALVAK